MYRGEEVCVVKAKIETEEDLLNEGDLYEVTALIGNPGRTSHKLRSKLKLTPGSLVSYDGLRVFGVLETDRFRRSLLNSDLIYLEDVWADLQEKQSSEEQGTDSTTTEE